MRKILIIEDNFMIEDMVEDVLLENGHEVCGIAPTVSKGLALCEKHRPDLLLVDLRLSHGELGTELAAKLFPFGKLAILYVTGNKYQVELSSTDGHGCLSKPFVPDVLLRCIEIVSDIAEGIEAKHPFPPGFHVLPPPAFSHPAMAS